MATITTADLQALAASQLLDLRKRADDYLQQAIAVAGTDKALQLSRMLDDLATQTLIVSGLDLACIKAGDWQSGAAIHADSLTTEAAIAEHAHTARMVSIPGWCWVSKTFKDAAARVQA